MRISPALTIFQILAFQVLLSWTCTVSSQCTDWQPRHSMTNTWLPIFGNLFSLHHYANKIKCQKFELGNEGQGIEEKNWTFAIRLEKFDSYIYIVDFFQNFSFAGTYVYGNWQHTQLHTNTYTHTYTHTARDCGAYYR